MGTIHYFAGKDGNWDWAGVPVEDYTHQLPGLTKRRFISRQDGSENLELRYFELTPGASSNLEHHVHEHAVLILRGRGQVLLGEIWHPINIGDAIFIPSDEVHQFRAAEDDTLGFLCAVLDKSLRQLAHLRLAYRHRHEQLERNLQAPYPRAGQQAEFIPWLTQEDDLVGPY